MSFFLNGLSYLAWFCLILGDWKWIQILNFNQFCFRMDFVGFIEDPNNRPFEHYFKILSMSFKSQFNKLTFIPHQKFLIFIHEISFFKAVLPKLFEPRHTNPKSEISRLLTIFSSYSLKRKILTVWKREILTVYLNVSRHTVWESLL
jgi:hypothetical protein